MIRILVAILVVVVLLFALSSISQSYATAKQAEAAIEASRTAQIAGIGNLVTILVVAVVVVAVLMLGIFIVYFEIKGIPYRKTKSLSDSSRHFGQDNNGLLPAILTMMMYEMLQRQEAQQHSMLGTSHPETPVVTDLNDFWDM